MPDILNIFDDDAFGVVEMSQAVNLVPNTYGRVTQMGIFAEKGITTTSVAVEYKNGKVTLVQSSERGAPAPVHGSQKRTIKRFSVPHFALDGQIKADDLQNMRAFGDSSRLAMFMEYVNDKMAGLAIDIYQTIEWLRVTALRGVVLDADGETLLDMFTEFDVSEKSVNFALGTESTNVAAKCREVTSHIRKNLTGDTMTGVHCLCSSGFFDALVGHANVKEAYAFQQGQNMMRDDMSQNFKFQGITFEVYEGEATNAAGDTQAFIVADQARFFPVGTRNSFSHFNAPADYIETVNTRGLPLYARQAISDPYRRWVDLQVQANPLPLCHRPALLVKGTK